MSRRGLFGALGGLAVGATAVGVGGELSGARAAASALEPFYGRHQGGVTTDTQGHTLLAAFDITTEQRGDLAILFREWTAVGARLTAGRTAGPQSASDDAVEPDSGEAIGLGASRLTVNFGLGPTVFVQDGQDRFGLADQQPYELADLPAFPGDQLVSSESGGDLTVHACADDPQVAFHAVRQLARAAEGVASLRWTQAGFSASPAASGTPRNLLGFKDGTTNPRTEADLDQYVWVGYEGPSWVSGGTYLVYRRIRLALDRWDAQTLRDQERTIGRAKVSGAPLGRADEFAALDLSAHAGDGRPAIPLDAHVRLASPQENWGAVLLRRSFAFDNGVLPASTAGGGTHDAGVLLATYQRSPLLGFVTIFKKLTDQDALMPFTTHTGSAVAAILPGVSGPGEWVGQGLFAPR